MAHPRLDALLRTLAESGGSDLHVKVGSPPRIRVDGTLRRVEGETDLTAADTAEMAQAIMRSDIYERFTGAADVDFAYGLSGVGRFRANAFRQRGSVAMIFRLVRAATSSFEDLGLPEVVGRLALEHRGLVLVTGPTGSGKTTTLAAMIDHINRSRECHIVTIEDPIEVLHSDRQASINQREIGVDADSFATAMRAAMRQDPDVIFVGEMRDPETVWAALAAAETGHLVLSTLHTSNAVETVNRIVDFFPPHQHAQVRLSLATSMRGVVSQRLVARSGDGGGRVPVVEVLVNTGRVFDRIVDPDTPGDSIEEIMADGEFYGMQTFDQSILRLYREGVIGLREAMAAATSPSDLRVALQRAGLAAS
jgi:twitching motility protein PilT